MTTEISVRESPRDIALLKAVGLDRAAPEQRELAIAIAERYGLDLMLKHLVLIEGRPYVTRDALLHIAHRNGQLDGIVTTEPVLDGEFWRCSASVYRKDMSHPFTYGGRYPAKGGNARFAPEMALKVAESMALRRAFDIGAPSADERWDVDGPAEAAPTPKPTLAARVAERAAAVAQPAQDAPSAPEPVVVVSEPTGLVRCDAPSPYAAEDGTPDEPCAREAGHGGSHKNHQKASW